MVTLDVDYLLADEECVFRDGTSTPGFILSLELLDVDVGGGLKMNGLLDVYYISSRCGVCLHRRC